MNTDRKLFNELAVGPTEHHHSGAIITIKDQRPVPMISARYAFISRRACFS